MQIVRGEQTFTLTGWELYQAHKEFVTNWMKNTLVNDFNMDEKSSNEYGERAYAIYSSGKEEITEYEAIDKAFDEYEESLSGSMVLSGMVFTFVCDRPLYVPGKEKSPYYIVPGGYELKNGKRFDFASTEWTVDKSHPCQAQCIVNDLDKEYTKESKPDFSTPLPTKDDMKQLFSEFFMYTGEQDDPEIKVKEIKNLAFSFVGPSGYKTVLATKEQLNSINEYVIKNMK